MSTERAGGRSGSMSVGGVGPGVALAIAALTSSCFDGSSALGLPCRTDDDCGRGQRCEEGVCGGPPATGSAESSSGPGSSSTTDGLDSSSGAGTTEAPPGECGNGVPEEGEECDDGMETVECDRDCTIATCGDGTINAARGEMCDDGNTSAVDECNDQCLPNFFWDDMEDPMRSMGQWNTATPEFEHLMQTYSLDPGRGWQLGLPGMPDVGVWHSGPYSEQAGIARLITDEIDLPPLPGPGLRYELRFRHTYRFDGNNVMDMECMEEAHSDGAFVWILEDGQLPRQIAPPSAMGTLLADPGMCIASEPNPLFMQVPPPTVYGGTTGEEFESVAVPLNPLTNAAAIVFDMSYDCNNCWGAGPAGMVPPAPGWIIDDVVVGLYRM